jgi:acetyl-CoA carboxylase carboxyl transferase subunit alpha
LRDYLEFEKPLAEIEAKIEKLRPASVNSPKAQSEIESLERKAGQIKTEIYSRLTASQRMQIARHAARPTTSDYISFMIDNFLELHGDRHYGDDRAIIGGMGTFQKRPVMVIGHQKGRTVKERVMRNFGMPHPEGYRKAFRLMKMAEKFGKPLITFIDTPGAYPGIGAEERGQSEAIARNLLCMLELSVPIIAIVIGEGGSGGALALGIGDRVIMLEHSIYSVISPEGCAAILWDDPTKATDAAEALKMTSADLKSFGVIDEIIPEPSGGAHHDPSKTAEAVETAIENHLNEIDRIPVQDLLRQRYLKYRKMGAFSEERSG